MKTERARSYQQTARAEATQQTRRNIANAVVELWRRKELDQITLDEIAEEAGTTRQTLLRHFGSKDGLVDALIVEGTAIEEHRSQAAPGDVAGALTILLEHYERDGDAVLRGLGLENRSEAASKVIAHGRRVHRKWCEHVFGPFLPTPRRKDYQARVDAFVAATDIYLWKLLRRDLGRSVKQTREALELLLVGLTTARDKERS